MDEMTHINSEASDVICLPPTKEKTGLIRKATSKILRSNSRPSRPEDESEASTSKRTSISSTTPKGTKMLLGIFSFSARDKAATEKPEDPNVDKDPARDHDGTEPTEPYFRDRKAKSSLGFNVDSSKFAQGSSAHSGSSENQEEIYDGKKKKSLLVRIGSLHKPKDSSSNFFGRNSSLVKRSSLGKNKEHVAILDDFGYSMDRANSEKVKPMESSQQISRAQHSTQESETTEFRNSNMEEAAFKLRVLQREFDAYKKVQQDNMEAELRLKENTIETLKNSLKLRDEELKKVKKKAKYYYKKSLELKNGTAENEELGAHLSRSASRDRSTKNLNRSAFFAESEKESLQIAEDFQTADVNQIQKNILGNRDAKVGDALTIKEIKDSETLGNSPKNDDIENADTLAYMAIDDTDDKRALYDSMILDRFSQSQESQNEQHSAKYEDQIALLDDLMDETVDQEIIIEESKIVPPQGSKKKTTSFIIKDSTTAPAKSIPKAASFNHHISSERLVKGEAQHSSVNVSSKKRLNIESIKENTFVNPSEITRKKSYKKSNSRQVPESDKVNSSFIHLNASSKLKGVESDKAEQGKAGAGAILDQSESETKREISAPVPPFLNSGQARFFQQKDALAIELEVLKEETENFRNHQAEYDQELADLREAKENLLRVKDSLEREILSLREEIEELKNRQVFHEKNKQERDNLLAEKQMLEKDMSDLKETEENFKNREAAYNQKLEENKAQFSSIEKIAEERKLEIDRLKKKVNREIDKIKNLQSQLVSENDSRLDIITGKDEQIAVVRESLDVIESTRHLISLPHTEGTSTLQGSSNMEEQKLELEKMKTELTLTKNKLCKLDGLKHTVAMKEHEIAALRHALATIDAESKRVSEVDCMSSLISKKEKLVKIIEDQEKVIEKLQIMQKTRDTISGRDVDISDSNNTSNQDQVNMESKLDTVLNEKNRMQDKLSQLEQEFSSLKQARNAQNFIESAVHRAEVESNTTDSENIWEKRIQQVEIQKQYYKSLVKALNLEKENAVQKVQALEKNFFLVPKAVRDQQKFLEEIPAYQEAIERASVLSSNNLETEKKASELMEASHRNSSEGGQVMSIDRIVTFVSLGIALLSILIMLIKGLVGN